MLNHSNAPEPTPRIIRILEIIDYYKWEPPKYNVGHDKLVSYYDEKGNQHLIENYNHPILTEIQKLK